MPGFFTREIHLYETKDLRADLVHSEGPGDTDIVEGAESESDDGEDDDEDDEDKVKLADTDLLIGIATPTVGSKPQLIVELKCHSLGQGTKGFVQGFKDDLKKTETNKRNEEYEAVPLVVIGVYVNSQGEAKQAKKKEGEGKDEESKDNDDDPKPKRARKMGRPVEPVTMRLKKVDASWAETANFMLFWKFVEFDPEAVKKTVSSKTSKQAPKTGSTSSLSTK